MSDQLAFAIISGVVTIAGAIITGVVAVLTIKIRQTVQETKDVVNTIPAHVTNEAETTRAALAQNAATAARLERDGSPDDVAPGAVHTHQRVERRPP